MAEIKQAVSHCFLGSTCKIGRNTYTIQAVVKATPRTRRGGRYSKAILLSGKNGDRIVAWDQEVIAFESDHCL